MPGSFWSVVTVIVVAFFAVPVLLFVDDRRRERRHLQLSPPSHPNERNY